MYKTYRGYLRSFNDSRMNQLIRLLDRAGNSEPIPETPRVLVRIRKMIKARVIELET